MKISFFAVVLSSALTVACSGLRKGTVEVIPQPNNVRVSERVVEVGKITFKTDPSFGPEQYKLIVKPSGRTKVVSGGSAGEFYALRTLAQEKRNGGVKVGVIEDIPRFEWRGFMLDESRHFFGEEKVKSILDAMADLKLNKFHWHLTDASGWRIEIKAFPLLTEVGAVGNHSDIFAAPCYYTQDQIKSIVAYAAERHIEVIPEIDMPGHASAATKAYPEYSGGGVSAGFPAFTFNVGKEETYEFLTAILKEVAELFPSEYIMTGGDEVSFGSYAWKTDPDIAALMKREGYGDVLQAEGYFMRRMAEVVRSLGKKMIGWDDIVSFGTPSDNNLLMYWRHDKPERLHECIDGGYATILCPRKPMYFDFVQDDSHKVGRKWNGFCPIGDVYSFPDSLYEEWGVTPEYLAGAVKGIQANLWSEVVHNEARLDFMTFPRIYAAAEAAWTLPGSKDFDAFNKRLEREYIRMDEAGIYYYDYRDPFHHPEPEGPVMGVRAVDVPGPVRSWQDFRD